MEKDSQTKTDNDRLIESITKRFENDVGLSHLSPVGDGLLEVDVVLDELLHGRVKVFSGRIVFHRFGQSVDGRSQFGGARNNFTAGLQTYVHGGMSKH